MGDGGMGDNLGVLEAKLDGVKQSVDAMWEKINSIAHVLYEGNGDSLTTAVKLVAGRVAALEIRCGTTCPVSARVSEAERQLEDTRKFRRQVGVGLVVTAIGGLGTLAVALIQALSRAGVHL